MRASIVCFAESSTLDTTLIGDNVMAFNIDGLATRNSTPPANRRKPRHLNIAETSWAQRGFASALDNLGLVSIADASGRILHINDEFCRVSKYARDELLGRTHSVLDSAHHPSAFWAEAYRALAAGKTWRAPIRNRAKDGTHYWVEALIAPLRSRNVLKGYLSIQRDITDVVALRAKADESEALAFALAETFPGSVAAFNKDHTLVLSNRAFREEMRLPDDPTAARISAEDFYRFEGAPGNGAAPTTIERGMPDGNRREFHRIPLPTGGFIATQRKLADVSGDPAPADDLAHRDPAANLPTHTPVLARVGDGGTPEGAVAATAQHTHMVAELREALAQNAFELHYQPVIDIKTLKIVGCEALIRWSHPEHGLIPASDFIPVAESCGLIGEIGDWVLKTACIEAGRWPENVSVAVNISAAQFTGSSLVERVLALSKGLPLSRLVLEITESLLMKDHQTAATMLGRLKRQGARFAIDDFGTGFSSLSYLQSFPFDKIKIDRSFVSNLANQKRSTTLRRSIIQLGYNLGMTSVAEGVETKQQLDLLRAEGCLEAQGFFFSRAVPATQIRQLLATSD